MINNRRKILKLIGLSFSASLIGCKEKNIGWTPEQFAKNLKLHNYVGLQVIHVLDETSNKVNLKNIPSFFDTHQVSLWDGDKKKINGRVKRMIKQNFIDGKTVSLDGYIFAETEVSLYKAIKAQVPELLEKF